MMVELADVVSSRDDNIEGINVPKNSPLLRPLRKGNLVQTPNSESMLSLKGSLIFLWHESRVVLWFPPGFGGEPNSDISQ